MVKFRYQDFIDELASGLSYGVFIDDAGSPGQNNTAPAIHPERKSWVAVVVQPSLAPTLLEGFAGAVAELTRLPGVTEFHAVDIYSGKGPFREMPLEARLVLFEGMARLISGYNIPLLVQTLDPQSMSDVRSRAAFPEKLGPLDLTTQGDLALLFLLSRVYQYLRNTRSQGDTLARVFIDEGRMKSGVMIQLPGLDDVFANGVVCFADSTAIQLLRLR